MHTKTGTQCPRHEPHSAPGRAVRCPERGRGTRGVPEGAQHSLSCEVRSCLAFPVCFLPHPVSYQCSPSVPCFSCAGAGSVLPGGPADPAQHRPGAAEGRQRHLAAGEIPPEEGAVVINFAKLSSGPHRCPYGDGEEARRSKLNHGFKSKSFVSKGKQKLTM